MQVYAEKDEYYCALMGKEDFETFAAARTLCYRDKTASEVPRLGQMLAAIDREGNNYWNREWNRNDAYFVLFKKGRTGPDEIAGISDVHFVHHRNRDITPRLETMHVLTPFRGQQLIDLLYQANINFLVKATNYNMVSLWTMRDNPAAIRAAERNSFVCHASDAPIAQKSNFLLFTYDLEKDRKLKMENNPGGLDMNGPG